MKKNAFLVLSVIIVCSMFSSCGVVEKTYPLIDYVTVEKSSQDLYARNDAFCYGRYDVYGHDPRRFLHQKEKHLIEVPVHNFQAQG